MSISKWYEIYCNRCGCASRYAGSVWLANEQYKAEGGIVKGKNHFCNKVCQRKFKEHKK